MRWKCGPFLPEKGMQTSALNKLDVFTTPIFMFDFPDLILCVVHFDFEHTKKFKIKTFLTYALILHIYINYTANFICYIKFVIYIFYVHRTLHGIS